MAAASDPVVCDGQVEDQAAVPCSVLEIALDFHVAAPLTCAGRHLVLRADRVSSCWKRGPRTPTAQSCALVAPECAVQVDVWSPKRSIPCFLQPHRAGALVAAGEFLICSVCS